MQQKGKLLIENIKANTFSTIEYQSYPLLDLIGTDLSEFFSCHGFLITGFQKNPI